MSEPITAFIERWQSLPEQASEIATSQSFVIELCRLLELPVPHATAEQDYMFERPIVFRHGDGSSSQGRIDCYRRGAFVWESKKLHLGGNPASRRFDDAMLRARAQAEAYARALPAEEGRPPFLVVADIGHVLELYAEFSRSGGTYLPYPDPRSHRIRLQDLHDPAIRERLRLLWLDPLALDPARHSARVTRELAARLAELARSLEAEGHPAQAVAGMLTRCLFCMFAEDVGLLPKGSYSGLLASLQDDPAAFVPHMQALWQEMDRGGYSVALRAQLPRFNGKLFKTNEALPLSGPQIRQLLEASKANWTQVEPAIFGTLLERALDPDERHALGAHYTPRAYVDRLVQPTVVEPLREQWAFVQGAAVLLAQEGKREQALAEVRAFHHRLCSLRVLDPACGSGNFLYVALEHLKRLEGEVLNQLHDLGETQGLLETEGLTVDPHQFLGLEINPRAAAIAELVLWIGYLQWHFRTRSAGLPSSPILKDFQNIECRDAVLADGKPATWPEADYVVGNPPFIGASTMRAALGDAYVEALRQAHAAVPDSADYVMYWWQQAAQLLAQGKIQRFGFITTNSLRQTFNRRVVQAALDAGLHLAFAIPDHPWVDSADGAAVRIAMTVLAPGPGPGRLLQVEREQEHEDGREGREVELAERQGAIHADLTIGANVAAAQPLRANENLCNRGLQLFGAGFIVTQEERTRLEAEAPIKPYRNGRDLTDRPRGVLVIDLFGFDAEDVRRRWPATYQHVLDTVKPERDKNNRASYRDKWWIFGEPRKTLRQQLAHLPRYIVTVETAKHRIFQFLDASIAPDNMLVCIAHDDAYVLSVLSSRIHVTWALATGGRLGIGNDPRYNKSRCFETFPFPEPSEAQASRIRDLGKELDAHRKRVLAEHAELTLTGLYNVLDKRRSGAALTAKEQAIHTQGLVGVLDSLHADLDAAVLAAYGWTDAPSEEAILERLVALNAARRAEEAQGQVRWLRPAFQQPQSGQAAGSASLALADEDAEEASEAAPVRKKSRPSQASIAWPATLPEQMAALAAALTSAPQSETELAARFSGLGKAKARLPELLATLAALGRARALGEGRWAL